MRELALGLLIGVLALTQLASLPPVGWAALALTAAVPALLHRRGRLAWAMLAGFGWASLQAYWQLEPRLPEALEGRDLTVQARIASVPERYPDKLRFEAEPLRIVGSEPVAGRLPDRLLLSWYRDAPELAPGEVWQLRVRLKRPRGFLNPGGFDYETWLFERGIGATGSVRESESNRRIEAAGFSVDGLRSALARRISDALGDDPMRGVVLALAIGVRFEVAQEIWLAFLRTGTNHLMAISGLHVGMVGLAGYWVVRRLWSRSRRLCLLWPAQKAGAVLSLALSCSYALLAGFSVPTQRTVLMQAVVVAGVLSGRRWGVSNTLAAALIAVLLHQSLAVLSVSFWLSFAAVAVLMWLGQVGGRGRGWHEWIRVQLGISLALLPLTLWLFGQGSLISPVANLLAIPAVSFVIVPAILVGVALLVVWPPLGGALLGLASQLLAWLVEALDALAGLPNAFVNQPVSEWWVFMLASVGVFYLFAPRGVPARWLGPVLALPLATLAPRKPEVGGFRVTVLDVGQGLSVVVETRAHVLVYDTGARFSERLSAASHALLPFLRHRGIQGIDRLVISHEDNDHAGGLNLIRAAVPVGELLHSAPDRDKGMVACASGQSWRWDGVTFSMLGPEPGQPGTENDRSCVLRVVGAGGSVLLTGDIGTAGEAALLARHGEVVNSTVMVAPHHGSRTSSSEALVAAVRPTYVVYSAGYRNRFGFPHEEAVRRYAEAGARGLRTDVGGALEFDFPAQSERVHVTAYRQQNQRFWRWQNSDELDGGRVSPPRQFSYDLRLTKDRSG